MQIEEREYTVDELYALALGSRDAKWHGSRRPGPKWKPDPEPINGFGDLDLRFFAFVLSRLKREGVVDRVNLRITEPRKDRWFNGKEWVNGTRRYLEIESICETTRFGLVIQAEEKKAKGKKRGD